MNAIEVRNLTKVYEKQQGWRWRARGKAVASATVSVEAAVSDLSLTIPQGELFGLLGPNGAGKTTLVKMLCTLILPSSGTAVIDGHDLTNAGAIRATIGLVISDDRSFYWRLSVRRNLDFFAAMYGLDGRTARQRIDEVLTQVDLTAVADQRFGQLSSGMRQRLAIARSLLHRPQLLFLDEPSRSLDPKATQRLHDLVRQLMTEQEMTVFLITHDLAEAEALCNRVALMHKGQIQAIGAPEHLRRQLYREQVYTLHVGEVGTAVLQTLQHIPSFTYQSNHIQLRAVRGDGVLTAVLDTLRQNDIPIHHIESSPPSLEEVFNHFTNGQ